jgi:hypothetical protein
MAGNTATINRVALSEQWISYLPMAAICQHWTITKDQLVRLRNVWELPLRLDRRRRHKPSREERLILDPDNDELAASEASLDLAPLVAERVTAVQAMWSEAIRAERQVVKPTAFRLARIEVPEEMREMLDNINRDCER